MKSYKPYPKYKDSGVDWLHSVPEKWEIKPLLGVAVERKVKNIGNIVSNVLSLSYGNIIQRTVETDFGLLPASFETYQIVEPDDIILRLTDLQNDKRSLRTGRVKERGIITSAYLCLRPLKSIVSRYLHYLLHAYDIQKIFYSMGGGVRQSMGIEDMRRLPLTLPSVDEQQTVASFLDRETARIDALIEKKQRLIELLQEKRQAIITQVVTTGLDTSVPMKDSGVQWLGEVPEHWEVKKGAYIGRLFGTENLPDGSLSEEGNVLYLKVDDLNHADSKLNVYESKQKYDETILSPVRAEINFVAFPKRGGAIFTNKVCIVNKRALLDPNLMGWKINSGTDERFIAYCLLARRLDDLADVSTVPQINNKHLYPEKFPFPDLPEQKNIAAHIDETTAKIDTLLKATEESIQLLQERRSALITAAVTGQIDVREVS